MSRVFAWRVLPDANNRPTVIQTLPVPISFGDSNICAVAGAIVDNAKGYLALNGNGVLFAWQYDATFTEVIVLPLPDSVMNIKICAIGGVGVGAGFIALGEGGQLLTWGYNGDGTEVIEFPLPPELAGRNICAVGGAGGTAGYIVLDDSGQVFTWYIDSTGPTPVAVLLPLPTTLEGRSICAISGVFGSPDANGFVGFISLDRNGEVIAWNVLNTPGGLVANPISTPAELAGVRICSVNGVGGVFGYTAIDNRGRAYTFFFQPTPDTANLVPVQVAPPAELEGVQLCSIGGGNYNFANAAVGALYMAIDSEANLYTWYFQGVPTTDTTATLLPLPPAAADRNICGIGKLFSNSFIAVECTPLTILCQGDISVESDVPTTVEFAPPTASDTCYSVECHLDDGTLVTPDFVFPIGSTRVNCVTVADRCNNTCVGCEECVSCFPPPATCSFVVTVRRRPVSPPVTNTVITVTGVIDRVVYNQEHQVQIEVMNPRT